MNFQYTNLLEHGVLWIFPLITSLILACTLIFMCTDSVVSKKVDTQLYFVAMLLLMVFGIFFLRYQSVTFSFFFSLTKHSHKWVLFFFIFSLVILTSSFSARKEHTQRGVEINTASVFLFWFWLSALLANSLLTLIIFLELCGLVLSIVFVYSTYEYANNQDSTKLNKNTIYQLLNSLILFLWVSAFSLLWLLWFLFLALPEVASMNFVEMNLCSKMQTTFNGKTEWVLFLFGLALSLKLMFFPWQTVMFSFYAGLPFSEFIIYIVFYYSGFLVILTKLILTALAHFMHSWLWVFAVSTPVMLLLVVLLSKQTFDIKSIFTVSSILSLSLIILSALL